MQIVEAKNNLVKVSYDTSEENLVLSGFVVIKDMIQSFIGQIVNLETNSRGNFAIVKLLFTFNEEGIITNYNGSVPNVQCPMDIVKPQELLELLPIQNPIIIGDLAQQKTVLNLDRSLFEKKLLICSEKEENNEILIKNFAQQLTNNGKKVLVIDLNGNLSSNSNFSANTIIATENFKLPLNYNSINFIYEKGLDGTTAETKAIIQEIFLEVQDYVKTLPEQFIPFETFKDVVDDQYNETELVELVLLKNRLLKYYEAGIFAQQKEEFNSLRDSLEMPEISVLDLSQIDENIQREMICYAYSLIAELDKEIYVFCNINNANSDKKLLKQILTTKNAYSSLICPYAYKYLKELKQISKDLILFAPIQQQDDFAGYSAFLNKLNIHEFIIYGEATHHLPLIVNLNEIPITDEQVQPQPQQQPTAEVTEQDLLDEEIKRDVDEFYTATKVEQGIIQEDEPVEEFSTNDAEEDLTEDDLDFIDDLGVGNEEIINTEQEIVESSEEEEDNINSSTETLNLLAEEEMEESFEDESISEEVPTDFFEEEIEETPFKETIEITEEETEEIEANLSTEEEPQLTAHSSQLTENPSTEEEEFEQEAPAVDILPVRMSSAPIVPIYSADVESEVNSDDIVQGDTVMHPKYGKGTVEKLINYGSKTLCSINFDNVGRRLLDPALAELKKV